MRKRSLMHTSVMIVIVACGVARSQEQREQSIGSGVEDLQVRLSALSPDDPLGYFELGEEISYEMPMDVARDLARRLFVLSAALDAESVEPIGLTPSACIALSELSTDAEERRWLRELAEAAESGDGRPLWRLSTDVHQTDDTQEEFAKAMGAFRAGDGGMLRSMLRRVDAETLLKDAGMEPGTAIEVARELDRLAPLMRPPGPGRDGRVIRSVRDGQQYVEIDPETGGNPGPDLGASSYIDHLRAEAMLLDARPSTWSGTIMLERGRAFRDLDPDELGQHFGVDVSATVWRESGDADWTGGSWVRP